MGKRLQVLLNEPEYQQVVRIAQAQDKIAAIRLAAACSFPSGDVGDMLADIERGRSLGVDGD